MPATNGYPGLALHTSAGLHPIISSTCAPSTCIQQVHVNAVFLCIASPRIDNELPVCISAWVRAWRLDVYLPELHSCILTSPRPLDVKKKFRSSFQRRTIKSQVCSSYSQL